MKWLLLVLSLPTQNTTARMRAWRTLKSCGAAVLRDGVYLLPLNAAHRSHFDKVAIDVEANEGSAQLFITEAENTDELCALFNRSEDYAGLLAELDQMPLLASENLAGAIKQLRKLRKNFAAIVAIDFFPTGLQAQTQQALQTLEVQLNRQLSPNEPAFAEGDVPLRVLQQYQHRIWATRKRPWVDRLACAWLIKRFIDPDARFLWLESPDQCPADAVGFDFDGADFTHIGQRVSVEVLLASFGLNNPELIRLGALVHYLDVGGLQPMEASGLEQILWGLRNSITDDDQLLAAACGVFDALLAAFTHKENV
jgi:hypothetical protein